MSQCAHPIHRPWLPASVSRHGHKVLVDLSLSSTRASALVSSCHQCPPYQRQKLTKQQITARENHTLMQVWHWRVQPPCQYPHSLPSTTVPRLQMKTSAALAPDGQGSVEISWSGLVDKQFQTHCVLITADIPCRAPTKEPSSLRLGKHRQLDVISGCCTWASGLE
jgi:hypothetical protein